MATNTWKALQPISRLNRQSYRFLSVLRERGKLTGSKHTRALTQNSKKGTEAGFQKNEFYQPGEHLYGNGLTITGDNLSAGMTKASSSPVNMPGVKDGLVSVSGTKNAFECKACSNLMLLFGKKKASPRADQKDSTRTKESLCGILFNCYVVCLFVFGSNVPFAS
ncbi:uncharacterized protein LOC144647051 [Oculina patagonica]